MQAIHSSIKYDRYLINSTYWIEVLHVCEVRSSVPPDSIYLSRQKCVVSYIIHLLVNAISLNVKWSVMFIYWCIHTFSWIQLSWDALLITEDRGSSVWWLSRFWWHSVLSLLAVPQTRRGCRFWRSCCFSLIAIKFSGANPVLAGIPLSNVLSESVKTGNFLQKYKKQKRSFNSAIVRYFPSIFAHMFLCRIRYQWLWPNCCKGNSFGDIKAINCEPWTIW